MRLPAFLRVACIVALLLVSSACTTASVGTDASADVGVAARLCDPAWAFCDDFEHGLAAAWTQTGDVGVAASTAGGTSASMLRLAVGSGGEPASVAADVPATTTGEEHVRLWVRLPAGTSTTAFRLVELRDTSSDSANWVGVSRRADGTWQLRIGQSLPTGEGSGPGSPTSVPSGTWVCAEITIHPVSLGSVTGTSVHARVSSATGALVAETELGVGDMAVDLSTYTALGIGALANHASEGLGPIVGPLELDIDDVVYDDAPIGCAPPAP